MNGKRRVSRKVSAERDGKKSVQSVQLEPEGLCSLWMVIPEAPQSSRSILRPQEVGRVLLLIAIRRESSWNSCIPVNKAVAKLSKRQVVFLQYDSQWETESAKTQNVPSSAHLSGNECYCQTKLIMLWILPWLHIGSFKILESFKIMSKTHPQKLIQWIWDGAWHWYLFILNDSNVPLELRTAIITL